MQIRTKPLVTVVIVTHNREQEVLECIDSVLMQYYAPIEVIIVDNNSKKNNEELCINKISGREKSIEFKFVRLDRNMGPCVARNTGYRNSRGAVLVFLDDDVILRSEHDINSVVEKFTSDAALGMLTFKSVNYFTHEVDPIEYPHPDKSRNFDQKIETTYFIGLGYAVKRETLEKSGLYAEDFFMVHEEFDLAYRIMDSGYSILYDPAICVYHKVTRSGRIASTIKLMKKTENKIKIAIRNLPLRNIISISILWSGKYLLESKGDIMGLVKIYINIFKAKNNLLKARKVIKQATIKRIRKLGGYLYY